MTRRMIVVWLVLLVATLASLSVEQGHLGAKITGVVVTAIALFKVRLIGQQFMGLREAVRPLRLAFDTYVTVVAVILITIQVVFT